MPLPKPTVLPEWAMSNEVDPISGQNNVVVPPPEKKLLGWDYLEIPNRQWWNWFQRTVSDWIAYFNENLDFSIKSLTPSWEGLDVVPSDNLFYYTIQGNICFFNCELVWGGNGDTDPLKMMDLPFFSNSIIELTQSIHISRAGGPTIPLNHVLSAFIEPNSKFLEIKQENLLDGYSTNFIAGNEGHLLISGFYFIEPI